MPTTPLRVAFDAYNLSLAQGTGIATYTRNLETALLDFGAEVHAVYGLSLQNRGCPLEVAFFDAFRAPARSGRIAHLRRLLAAAIHLRWPLEAKHIPLTGIVDHRQLSGRLPRRSTLHNATDSLQIGELMFRYTGNLLPISLSTPVDVFHLTCPFPLKMRGVANVCTIHDLIPLTLPFTTLHDKESYWRLLARILSDFDILFADSQATKDDVKRVFGIADERIFVTYMGVDMDSTAERETPEELAALLTNTFGLDLGGYLLCIGAIEPRKNLPRLLEAYLSSGTTMPLVLAGPDGWLVEEQMRLWSKELVGDKPIVRIPHLPRSLLLRLIRGARALVFPSLCEGFGLPALEAMALGCPVVAARAGALPEVCGEAALFVDPYDSASIAAALREVAMNQSLCARLSAEGRQQATIFSMAHYGERLTRGYEAAIEAHRTKQGALPRVDPRFTEIPTP